MREKFIVLLILVFNILLFAEEETKSLKEIMPYAAVLNESEVTITGPDVKESFYYNGYDNKSSVEGGISFIFNEKISLKLFLGASDFNWMIDKNGSFYYISNEFYAGLGLEIVPSNIFLMALYLDNIEIIDSNSRIRSGFNFGFNIALTIEKAFLDISLSNNLKPSFNQYIAVVYNSTGYELKFNALNFIHEKINTGLLISGEYEGTVNIERLIVQTYSYSNEFYTGIISSPLKILKIYLLFAMCNEGIVENKILIKGSKINWFGLKTGVSISTEKFSIEGYYLPKIAVFIDDKKESSEHVIGLTFSLMF